MVIKNVESVYVAQQGLLINLIKVETFKVYQDSINTSLAAWKERGGLWDLTKTSLGTVSTLGGMVFMFVYRPIC